MKKNQRRNLISLILLFGCSLLAIFLLVRKDFNNTLKALVNVKWIFLAFAIFYQVLMPMIDGWILMILSRRHKHDYTYKEGYINNLVGLLFCYITPSATGGQFAQATVFSKQGIPASKSCSSLVINFFTYEIACIIYSFVTIIFNLPYMRSNVQTFEIFGAKISFMALAIIGFAINLFVAFGILALCYSNFINKLVHGVYKLLAKLHFIKDIDKANKSIDTKVAQFKENINDLKNMKKQFIQILLLNFLKLTIQFVIPFFCILAVGIHIDIQKILIIISLSCYLMLITTFIPIPGSSGGAELFFVLLFTPLLNTDSGNVSAAMMIWRLATFYVPLFYTFIVTLRFNKAKQLEKIDYVPTRHMWYFYKDFQEDNIYNNYMSEDVIEEEIYK